MLTRKNTQPEEPELPKTEQLENRIMKIKTIKVGFILLVTLVCYCLPMIFPQALPFTPVQNITMSVFVAAALLWILEPMPVYATSLSIIGSLCLLASDGAITPIKNYLKSVDGEHLLSYKSVFNSFSSPVIILFLGGFALAIASTKYKLDINLARVLLKPFGKKPNLVMLGVMCVTGFFAMFMSNTATTVMMLSMMAPVFASVKAEDKGIKALILAVPFAANVGGIATPVGTPPNAIALGFLHGEHAISFVKWMSIGFPLAVICIIATWFLLKFLFPFSSKEISLEIKSKFNTDWKSIFVYICFSITILLWMTEKLHGINSYIVAILPLIAFTCTGIIKAQDIKTMNWDVIWLIAGGIAIGNALETTGLAAQLANMVDYSSFSGLMIVGAIAVIGWILSNFISNTAAANLLIPIAVAVLSSPSINTGIDMSYSLMFIALALSFAMTLPISTPPNALAYATGKIKNIDMIKAGGIVSVLCMLMSFVLLYIISLM